MITNFRRDSRGLAEILKGPEMRAAIAAAADQTAANVRGQVPARVRVTTEHEVTDRQRATVLVAGDGHPHRQELIRAARAAGLEVHEYPPAQ
ncbi:hypothetical protein [Streptomyces sp. NPDC057877]|uniref:hypothetical protein n=1 Tax=Streptomyces sp. NPDC057877 TaxID=3346269 RepID=UPI0036AB3ABC